MFKIDGKPLGCKISIKGIEQKIEELKALGFKEVK